MIEFNPSGGFFSGFVAGRVRKLAILGMALCGCAAADAKIIYVNESVDVPGKDGTNWTKACKYLQDALEKSIPGDSIYLAKGTYYPDDGVDNGFGDREISFVVDGLKLYGGFTGNGDTFEERNPVANRTSLSGEIWQIDPADPLTSGYDRYWSLHVITLKSSSILDGLTVEKGRANGDAAPYSQGGGVYAPSGSTLTAVNCVFDLNLANQAGGAVWGNVVATGCVFSNNIVNNDQLLSSSPQRLNQYLFNPDIAGGAIFGDVQANRCLFSKNSVTVVSLDLGNVSSASGGAIAGNVTAVDTTFDGNSTSSASFPLPTQLSGSTTVSKGGAISGTNITATTCTFINNTSISQADSDRSPDPTKPVPYTANAATYGAAVAGQIVATNCSFAKNVASSKALTGDVKISVAAGGALYVEGTSSVVNCVFSENSGSIGGAIHNVDGSFLPIMDSTFVDNLCYGTRGAAVSCGGSVNILSNIFWFSGTAVTGFVKDKMIHVAGRSRISNRLYPTPSTETLNIVKGALSAITRSVGANVDLGDPPERSLINKDPLFIDAAVPVGVDNLWGTADDGLRLGTGSPAAGLGKPLFLPKDVQDLDKDGNTDELVPLDAAGFGRIQDGTLDLGAYELGDNLNSPDINVEQPVDTVLVDGTSIVDFSSKPGIPTTFVIRNTGIAQLRNLVVTVDGTDAASFKITQPVLKTLDPATFTTFVVTFQPTSSGLRTAAIHITSNDPDESPFDIAVSGNALLPDIGVEQPTGTGLTDGLSTVAFGSIGDTASLKKTFTITNAGPGSLVIQGVTVAGANPSNFVASAPVLSTVPSGSSTTMDVTFTPGGAGNRSASLIIESNDPDTESSFLIQLTGTGVGVPEIVVSQPFSPELVDGAINDFGSVQTASRYSKSFVIKNTGTATLKNIAVSLSGSTTFTKTDVTAKSLAPGARTSFTVTFKPGTVGSKTAALQIKSSDANESQIDITLVGTGISSATKKVKSSAGVVASLASTSPKQAADWLSGESQSVTATQSEDGSQYLVLTVEKSAGRNAAEQTVEVSSNLVDWYSGAKHTTVLLDNASILQVRDNTPFEQGAKRYIRLK